jgi:hypothetical protein
MNQQYTPNLGSEPAADARRDCVHVAVAPVVAAHHLRAGQHVGILADGRASSDAYPIGVVDPFRKDPIWGGDKFWIFIFPGTVTSLRHCWTHPAFVVKVPESKEHQPFKGEI